MGENNYHAKSVLHGVVFRIDSFDPNCQAIVQLDNYDGENRLIRMAVGRLLHAGVAYSGGIFNYIIEDNGSVRTSTIEPDIEANERKRVELEQLLKDFLEEG